jgi:hypothetical protein
MKKQLLNYEKENIQFLKEKEEALCPGGYQLDK